MTTCAYDPCSDEPSGRSKYCTDAHRKAAARGNYKEREAEVKSILDAKDLAASERDRLKAREMVKTLRALSKSEARAQEYVDAIKDVLEPFQPSPVVDPYPIFGNEYDDKIPVDWVDHNTDWHIGQRTTFEQTGGMYEQNTLITRAQVDLMWEAKKSIFARESAGKRVGKLWRCITGDIVEGDSMRASQLTGIDLSVTEQAVEAADLLALAIRRDLTLPGITTIDVDTVGGNHDRTTAKPGNAGLGETSFVDTWAFMISIMLERWFADEPRVTVKTHRSWYGQKIFAGQKFVFEHGASQRGGSGGGYGGTPWNRIANQASRLAALCGGADYVMMGHYHTPALLPLGQEGWLVMGGSLPATTTYVQTNFKSVRVPHQWLLEFHDSQTYGPRLTTPYPLYAAVPGTLPKPGAFWKDEGIDA